MLNTVEGLCSYLENFLPRNWRPNASGREGSIDSRHHPSTAGVFSNFKVGEKLLRSGEMKIANS